MDRQFIFEIRTFKCIKLCRMNLAQKRFLIYLILSFLAGSGFILILLGCKLWNEGWWALFVLFGIFFAAFPDIMFNRLCVRKNSNSSSNDFHERSNNKCARIIEDALFVIAGFFACVPFTLPLVLMHNNIISGNTAGMVISGSFLMMISGFVFMKLIYKKPLMKFCHDHLDEQGNEYSSEDEGYVFSFLTRNTDRDKIYDSQEDQLEF